MMDVPKEDILVAFSWPAGHGTGRGGQGCMRQAWHGVWAGNDGMGHCRRRAVVGDNVVGMHFDTRAVPAEVVCN